MVDLVTNGAASRALGKTTGVGLLQRSTCWDQVIIVVQSTNPMTLLNYLVFQKALLHYQVLVLVGVLVGVLMEVLMEVLMRVLAYLERTYQLDMVLMVVTHLDQVVHHWLACWIATLLHSPLLGPWP